MLQNVPRWTQDHSHPSLFHSPSLLTDPHNSRSPFILLALIWPVLQSKNSRKIFLHTFYSINICSAQLHRVLGPLPWGSHRVLLLPKALSYKVGNIQQNLISDILYSSITWQWGQSWMTIMMFRMPRALVEKWMPSQFLQVLPNKDTLSCADLVLFSAFVQWVKQGTVETGNQEDKIRLGFVALILNLACSLYELDPEKHCKQEKTGRSEPISESSPNKSPKQVN